jgi:hypothetical protein
VKDILILLINIYFCSGDASGDKDEEKEKENRKRKGDDA